MGNKNQNVYKDIDICVMCSNKITDINCEKRQVNALSKVLNVLSQQNIGIEIIDRYYTKSGFYIRILIFDWFMFDNEKFKNDLEMIKGVYLNDPPKVQI